MSDDLEAFTGEGAESLDRIEEIILSAEDEFAPATLDSLMREFHSLKGASSFFDLPRTRAIAHLAEDLIVKVQEKQIPMDQRVVDTLLQTVDALRTLLVNLEAPASFSANNYVDLISHLTSFDFLASPQRLASKSETAKSETKVFQLAYLSFTPESRLGPKELVPILSVARENNTKLGISGLLLYRDQAFLQVLEGDEESVRDLYVKIEKDPRHSNPIVLLQHKVAQRSFPDWAMGFNMMRCLKNARLDGLSDAFLNDDWGGRVSANEDFARYLMKSFKDNTSLV